MRLHYERNNVESIKRGWSSSIYKFWCVLQDSGIIKMIRNLAPVLVKIQALYTDRCIWDYTDMWRNLCIKAFEEPCFSGNIFNLMFFHTGHNINNNAHKLFLTSSQNSTFSLSFINTNWSLATDFIVIYLPVSGPVALGPLVWSLWIYHGR